MKHRTRVHLRPEPITVSEDQILVTRKQAAQMLGRISLDTIRALEHEGILTRIRLTGKPTSQIFFRKSEVEELAKGEAAE